MRTHQRHRWYTPEELRSSRLDERYRVTSHVNWAFLSWAAPTVILVVILLIWMVL